MSTISIKNAQLLAYIEQMPAGTKISVRELALSQNVSEGTAYKAVKDAEQRGLVSVKPKSGTVRIGDEPSTLSSKVKTPELIRALALSCAAGRENLDREIKRIAVCDSTAEDLARQLSGYDPALCLCLCGNRPDMHRAVIELGANLLVTSAASVEPALLSMAVSKGLYILTSAQSSYFLMRLFDSEYGTKQDLSGGETVSTWMQTPNYLYYNDIIADWQRFYFQSSLVKQYPVVDDDLNIFGGLDIWRAPAANPSTKLRSLIADRDELVRVSVGDNVKEVAKRFVVDGVDLAAVMDGEQLTGLISAIDLLRYYMHNGANSYEYAADSFLMKDKVASTDRVMVYTLHIPQAELGNIHHLEMDLMMSAAGLHLEQFGFDSYKLESGTYFAPKRISSDVGLRLTSSVLPQGTNSFVIEVEIIDDISTYAKAILIATGLNK